MLALRPTL
ncbi:rCG49634 [Rattus norvegicus]|uniref:RCG49634 n=1 Tax=Rattus norvegicus TaxID=10116 RepID=A6K2D4_RAT|nr:rCG49634 [Rattus norvegicus]